MAESSRASDDIGNGGGEEFCSMRNTCLKARLGGATDLTVKDPDLSLQAKRVPWLQSTSVLEKRSDLLF